MISPDFMQQIQLVTFEGGISYNSNGFAVLPAYNVRNIFASVQPADKSSIKFLPEGTHYSDYIDILTDYPVIVDNTPNTLGNYFIWNNHVYKIFSDQNYQQFTSFSTNHVDTTVTRDNRLTYDSNTMTLNIPFPEIDSQYAPLFEMIAMVASCFSSPALTVIWGFQQELRPEFPYCMVNIESVENMEGTNYEQMDVDISTFTYSQSKQLLVSFHFYAYEKITTLNMMEKFKLNRNGYSFSSPIISFMGFAEGYNDITEELYENRTIFHATVMMRFGWIVQTALTSTQTIETASGTLSITNT